MVLCVCVLYLHLIYCYWLHFNIILTNFAIFSVWTLQFAQKEDLLEAQNRSLTQSLREVMMSLLGLVLVVLDSVSCPCQARTWCSYCGSVELLIFVVEPIGDLEGLFGLVTLAERGKSGFGSLLPKDLQSLCCGGMSWNCPWNRRRYYHIVPASQWCRSWLALTFLWSIVFVWVSDGPFVLWVLSVNCFFVIFIVFRLHRGRITLRSRSRSWVIVWERYYTQCRPF